jgi:hypothetical protein
MSKKVPESIFKAFARGGKPVFGPDMNSYCIEHEGEELFVHVEPAVQLSSKMKLYAFYHVNILECAVIGYTAAGYEGIDKVKADYLLRAEFAKDFIKLPDGSYKPIMLDKKGMTMPRLLKYVQDCIFFIENELQIRVPEAEEFKLKKATGRNFLNIDKP